MDRLNNVKILYMTYDGILDPVGQSQVIPYLSRLVKRGVSITLLSFEKKDKWKQRDAVSFWADFLVENNIKWVALRYHKKPIVPATCFDILQGFLVGLFLAWCDGIQIIHVRGYVTGLMAWFIKKMARVRLLFDMRGFWPDEKVDGRSWYRRGFFYWLGKKLEKILVFGADEIVVLTEAAKTILKKKFHLRHISVIPCCVDVALFNPGGNGRKMSLLPQRFLVTYLGSVDTFYQLEEMIHFFSLLQKKITNAFFLIVTNGKPQQVSEILGRYGLKSQDCLVTSFPYHQVPEVLKQSKITLIFYHRPLSGPACCPIKFGESLSCGVPVIINVGIGDCEEIVRRERVGVVVTDYSPEAYLQAIQQIEDLLKEGKVLRERCRNVARKYFHLESGVEKYFNIYQRLTSQRFLV